MTEQKRPRPLHTILEVWQTRGPQESTNGQFDPTRTAEIIPFPVDWPDPERACPSCVLRSALFGVVQRGRRRYLERETLASWAHVSIIYSGQRLDQSDLDVWILLIHVAREHGLGISIPITAGWLLRQLGRHNGKRDYEWLKGVTARLTACAVEIRWKEHTYCGSLIEKFYRNERTGEYQLRLNPDLAVLFRDENYTRLDWLTRRKLHKDLAKWLHGYVQSHRATAQSPHRISIDRLRHLCGSETNLRDFRYKLKRAIAELQEMGIVTYWSITSNDALEFCRPEHGRSLHPQN